MRLNQRLPGQFSNLLRVMFMRGSPERFLYSRWRSIPALLGAIVLSALVQHFYFGDQVVFVILRVFSEVTMFMLWMVLLTAQVGRLRLANMMLVLVLISLFYDAVLLLLSLTPIYAKVLFAHAGVMAFIWGAIILYGAGNTVSWAIRSKLWYGCMHVFLYISAAFALEFSFRWLYEISVTA
ncbi:MAG: hypothetical protein GXP16_06445 [Gammaproteobacteria bacterium]|nr:hypothetical protein [Gammaproteobacteria bacterium]